MKRLILIAAVLALTLGLSPLAAMAQDGQARVRVVHASPDAPAVDVWVNGNVAFSNAPFKGITNYAELAPASYQVQVTPTGAESPVVIDATLDLAANTDYTVVAVGQLANIEPLVLVDNNATPAAGKAHVRFVHASPDAPAVDIAVKGGPVLFSNIAFKAVGAYLPVDAGTYDLEVRLAGTETVALEVPGLALEGQVVYTVFAMGLAGDGTLAAVPSVDARPAAAAPVTAAPAPGALPTTGGTMVNPWVILLVAGGAALIIGSLALQRRAVKVDAKK